MDTLFFILSKLLWQLLSPSSWLIIIPLAAVLFKKFKFARFAKLLWAIEISLITLIGFYPVGQWLVLPLENYSQADLLSNQNPTKQPDGIIVLGGAWLTDVSNYWQTWELNYAAEREMKFLVLAQKYPNAKLVFTGGSGKVFSQKIKEARYSEMLYRDFGLDVSRVQFEAESRNTFENAVFSKEIVQPKTSETWWLITSAYHLPRSIGVFCKQGWSVTPYPTDHFYSGPNWQPNWALAAHLWELELVTHEWLGLIVYRLTGRTKALFPERC